MTYATYASNEIQKNACLRLHPFCFETIEDEKNGQSG